MSTLPSPQIIEDVAARGDAALIDYTRRFDGMDLAAGGLRLTSREIADGAAAASPRPWPRCGRGGADRELSSPPAAGSDRLCRRGGCAARRPLAAGRRGRALRPGRHRRLSLFGVDERHPGEGGRGRAAGHDRADPARRAEPARSRRRPDGRDRRDISGRRRAGDRGARLWHGDDRAGRQDRRPGKRLCRGGQAAGLRQGRDRHDRRPVRDPGRRRPAQRPGMDRRRSVVAGGA